MFGRPKGIAGMFMGRSGCGFIHGRVYEEDMDFGYEVQCNLSI